MRDLYETELGQLERLLLEEGQLVDRAIRSALNALARDDLGLADELIAFDDEIDRRYLTIEQGIPSLLARHGLMKFRSTSARSLAAAASAAVSA